MSRVSSAKNAPSTARGTVSIGCARLLLLDSNGEESGRDGDLDHGPAGHGREVGVRGVRHGALLDLCTAQSKAS